MCFGFFLYVDNKILFIANVYLYWLSERGTLWSQWPLQPGNPRTVSVGCIGRTRQPVAVRGPTTNADFKAHVAPARVREYTTLAYEFWTYRLEQLPSLFQIIVLSDKCWAPLGTLFGELGPYWDPLSPPDSPVDLTHPLRTQGWPRPICVTLLVPI